MINRPPITHVAIRFQDKIWSLPAPNRHHHVFSLIVRETGVDHVDVAWEDEGFLDESGQFLNRRQALASAARNNQIIDRDKVRCDMLTSEDVW